MAIARRVGLIVDARHIRALGRLSHLCIILHDK
jgi:hypothetical protein